MYPIAIAFAVLVAQVGEQTEGLKDRRDPKDIPQVVSDDQNVPTRPFADVQLKIIQLTPSEDASQVTLIGDALSVQTGDTPNDDARHGTAPLTAITNLSTIMIGFDQINLSPAALEAVASADTQLLSDHFKVLVAPRMMILPSTPARVTIGAPVPYMVKQDDGSLRVMHSDDVREGVDIGISISKIDDAGIHFDDLSIAMTTVQSRAAIADVPFDVGAPEFSTQKVSLSLVITPGKTALIALPMPKDAAGTNGKTDAVTRTNLLVLLKVDVLQCAE